MNHEIKAVILDIDGTVSPLKNSWLTITQDLGASIDQHKAIFFEGFKQGTVSYETVRQQLTEMWRATGKATRPDFEAMFKGWPKFEEAHEAIDYFRSRGLPMAFVTGATSMYAKIIADRYGVENFYANGTLIFDADQNLVDFYYPYDETERKVEHLVAFCEKYDILPANVVAIGDGLNDLGVFTATGNGILVGPDRPELLQKASWMQAGDLLEAKRLLEPFLS